MPFIRRIVAWFKRASSTYLETFGVNAVVLTAATFFWGVPGVTIFRDAEWYDESTLGSAALIVAAVLLFFVWALVPQLAVYSLFVAALARRVWAMVFAPMAVGVLFLFATGGVGPALFAAGLTLSFGLSAHVPGSPVWWKSRPGLLLPVAGIFVLSCGAAELSQKLPGSDRTSLLITVLQADHRQQRFTLDCQYDQAGRVRGSKPRAGDIPAHPAGKRACEVLKSVEDSIADHEGYLSLNSCLSSEAAFARITGVYRNHRVGQLTVWRDDCLETYFVRDEPFVLVPPVS